MPKEFFKTHEWISSIGNNRYQMGISKYASDQLGDIVFIEEQDANKIYEPGSSLAILESVKAVGDIYSPFKAKLIQTNQDLISNPEELNENTWVVEIEATDAKNSIENADTMDKDAYLEYLETL
ncbi:MAG: glycine cleavage system protein GcvH [Cyanobacteriota bacterium]|jgi:glycine cleavage system H protein